MSQNSPLVMDFETDSGNEYTYDGVTSRVFLTPRPMREMIRDYRHKGREQMISELSAKYPADVLEDYYEQIQRWVDLDQAFFLEEPVPEETVTEDLDRRRRRQFRTPLLIVSVTSNCNVACKYCLQDKVEERMTWNVAKAGIDRFLDFNANPEQKALNSVYIDFYGGEPLLEFDLVRRCAEYARSKVDPSVKCHFQLTSNGVLLTDEVADYLAKNDFRLCVSLDGPREEHDRNRVTRCGKGTFDLVLNNLHRLRQRCPSYFESRTSILATYDFGTDLKRVSDWFDANKAVLPPLGRAGLASEGEGTCNRFTCEVRQDFGRRLGEVYSLVKETLEAEPEGQTLQNTFLYHLYGEGLARMANRSHDFAWQMPRLGCWPGATRIILYPDGTFHLCERLGRCCSIGDVETGVDIAKVTKVVSDFADWVTKKACRSCIAQAACQTCFLHMIGEKTVGFSCDGRRWSLENDLKYWYSIFEKNPHLVRRVRGDRHTLLDEAL